MVYSKNEEIIIFKKKNIRGILFNITSKVKLMEFKLLFNSLIVFIFDY
jgi:hypothetical protein